MNNCTRKYKQRQDSTQNYQQQGCRCKNNFSLKPSNGILQWVSGKRDRMENIYVTSFATLAATAAAAAAIASVFLALGNRNSKKPFLPIS